MITEAFLVRPSAFPTVQTGASWGTAEIAMSMCGCELVLRNLSPRQRATVADLWREFLCEPGPRATVVKVFRAQPSDFREIQRWDREYALEMDCGPDGLRLAGLDLMGRIDFTPSFRGWLWTDTEDPGWFHGALENFLRVLVAYAAPERGAVLLHSASVVDGSGANVFLGPSGAGKSTVSRLAVDSGRSVPSDDLNPVLRENGGDFVVAGSPFLGDIGARSPESHPLRAIYRLEKSSTDELRPLGQAEALASLMACAPFLNRDPHRRERLLNDLTALVRRVPSHVLAFRREGTFWSLLK